MDGWMQSTLVVFGRRSKDAVTGGRSPGWIPSHPSSPSCVQLVHTWTTPILFPVSTSFLSSS